MTAIAGVDFAANIKGFGAWYGLSGLARAGWNGRTKAMSEEG